MTRAALALLLLLSPIQAQMRVAVVTGQFAEESAGSLEWLNSVRAPGTAPMVLPVDFTLVVGYDETIAEDEEYAADLTYGEFNSENGSMDLYLGSTGEAIQIMQPGSQVQIHCDPSGLRAVGFGSHEPFEWNGLAVAEYGIYAFFWDMADAIAVPSSDSLDWLWNLQSTEQLRQQAYFVFRGFVGPRMVYLRTRGPLAYSVYVF